MNAVGVYPAEVGGEDGRGAAGLQHRDAGGRDQRRAAGGERG